ncbi:C4-dicarboxylate ABC transporter permease [Oceanidesulfovibrio indonesiensis]|uniref:C4-dicarboxylate ABC transporter permease n=1 Tax=Oceanidesulfovibrio indonesiensis TaxID=54767 RepID=A0A7M3MIE3_9BACT|nr:TRAP transporter large permease [Oceanidesulfovibrio indonesiensis]TVM19389.1 C4-dicarboxylate ABC transporter permease [Oceanidesulfovibrio indonesiensis]
MISLVAAVFVITLFLGVPVALCLGLSALAGLVVMDTPLILLAQRFFQGMNSFPLMAVPFFVLAGELMNQGGTTQRLINFASMLVGRVPGGLAQTNVVASMFFGGISGSAVADAAAIGSIMVPGMVRKGYSPGFSAAITAASSTMGPIIPPSIFMVIMGVTTGLSIGGLFAAGIVPGLLLGLSMIVYSYIVAIRRNYPKETEPITRQRVIRQLLSAGPALLAPVVILGGILGGVFTPTEAAAVAVLYSAILGVFIYRELNLKKFVNVLINSGITTSVLLLIIGMANIFAWVLTAEQVPGRIADMLLSITENPYLILLLINVFLVFIGMFLEGGAAIIILAPTLLAITTQVGIDPLHFGLIMVLNIVVGLLTPPLGVCLFVVCGVTGLSLQRVTRAVIPFLFIEFGVLLLATYFPGLILFLPRLFGYI